MYDIERLEFDMAAPMRNARPNRAAASSAGDDRRFPPEAYDFADDVTPEAVEEMRQKAKSAIDADEWEIVDGFGLHQTAT